MEASGQLDASAAPDISWLGGWVGPRACLNAVAKRRTPLWPLSWHNAINSHGSQPSTVQKQIRI